eukprot:s2587_g10.t1
MSACCPWCQTHSTLRWGEAEKDEEARGLRQPNDEQIRQMESWKAKRNQVIHSLSDTGLAPTSETRDTQWAEGRSNMALSVGQNYGSSRTVLVNNQQVDLQNLKELRDLPEKRRAGREQEIRSGAEFLQQFPRFPASRACADLPWAILFLLTLLAMLLFVATSVGELGSQAAAAAHSSRHLQATSFGYGGRPLRVDDAPGFGGSEAGTYPGSQPMQHGFAADGNMQISESEGRHLAASICLACVAGAVGGLVSAALWIMAAKTCASPVVYFSLYAIPSLLMVGGLLALLGGSIHAGIMLCLLGGLMIALTMCCWARYIPFTIEIVQMVATAFSERSEMVVISAVGGFVGPLWLTLVVLGYLAYHVKVTGGVPSDSSDGDGGAIYLFFFVLMWGSGVIGNVCHMAYCGVFSRWYFQQDEAPLLKSLHVATVTSFGSICFGTMIVAAMNTLEAVVRSGRRAAQEDGNIVGCVIALIMEAIISCIGDLMPGFAEEFFPPNSARMEYFNQWVYGMCALRGGSFCDSARGTCTLISCTGMPGLELG